jgi:uncharacterized RDD family membrane protein YckC
MAPSQRAAAADQPAALAYAGLQLRIVAFVLDVMVLISFGMLFGAGIGAYLVVDSHLNDGNLSDRAPYVAVAVLLTYVLAFLPLYHVVLWSWWGQTIGKMAVHIKVLSRTGQRVSLERSALRLLGYAASAAPLFLGVVIALFDRERRTLHDRLADTVVVELP